MPDDRLFGDIPAREAGRPRETDDHRRRRPASPQLKRFLSELVVGRPLHHDNLTLFPVFPANGGGAAGPAPYDLLETAIAAGNLDVTEERREAYAEALPSPGSALGVVAAIGDEIIGFDCFGRADVFAQLWDRLSQGYFLEALRDPTKRPVTDARAARAFVAAVAVAVEVADAEVGLGDSLDLTAEALAGGGLSFEGGLCHLGAFVDGACS